MLQILLVLRRDFAQSAEATELNHLRVSVPIRCMTTRLMIIASPVSTLAELASMGSSVCLVLKIDKLILILINVSALRPSRVTLTQLNNVLGAKSRLRLFNSAVIYLR